MDETSSLYPVLASSDVEVKGRAFVSCDADVCDDASRFVSIDAKVKSDAGVADQLTASHAVDRVDIGRDVTRNGKAFLDAG